MTAKFEKGQPPPMELLRQWVTESYRAVAPKTLVKELDARTEHASKVDR